MTPSIGGIDSEAFQTLLDDFVAEVCSDGSVAIAMTVGDATTYRSAGRLGSDMVSERSMFYGASLTKQLIGVLIAIGVAESRLDDEDPATRWVEGLPDWASPVRLRHLLHHTSGIPDVTMLAGSTAHDNADVLTRLAAIDGPLLPPGTVFAYNNTGYVLLAIALEQAFGMPIHELAATRLFEPLGMTASRLGGEPIIRIPGCDDPPRTIGDGGLWTNVVDLSRWLVAMNKRQLGERVSRLTETPGRLDDGAPIAYGWGVSVSQRSNRVTITHGGAWPGWLGKTVRIPEDRIVVAILAHSMGLELISQAGLDVADALIATVG